MARIFVTRRLPDEGMRRLRKFTDDFSLFPEDRPIREDELVENIRDVEGLICLLTDPVTKRVLSAAARLKIIANYAVGYDNIDTEYASKKGILVTNTPGVLTDATAECAWALLFSCARRVVEADRFVKGNKFRGWSPTLLPGTELAGRVLGIVGAGRIGTAFGLKGRGIGMSVLYSDYQRNKVLEARLMAERVELDKLLKSSDFVSIHIPLTEKTHHLIGEREIGLMKPSTYIINTSRGAVIDEKALISALKEGKIKGAGLDVYENEPDIPEDLINLKNVVLLPHIGSATYKARNKMAVMVVENLIAGLEGKRPPNLVVVGSKQ